MQVISLERAIIPWLRSSGCMEAPSWKHRVTNNGYRKSFTEVVVTAVAKGMVPGCVAVVTVPEDLDKTEEGEGEAKK